MSPMLPSPEPRTRQRVGVALGIGMVALAAALITFAVEFGERVPGLLITHPAEGDSRSPAPSAPLIPPAPRPAKAAVALQLLDGTSCFIHLDPRKPGVVVPPQFRAQTQLVLQVGRNMAIPIPDLAVDDEGIRGTLSFNQTPFRCSIPWSAVYALVDEESRGMVWPEDEPPEVVAAAAASAAAAAAKHPTKGAPRP
jgi:stringent starvation protein B